MAHEAHSLRAGSGGDGPVRVILTGGMVSRRWGLK